MRTTKTHDLNEDCLEIIKKHLPAVRHYLSSIAAIMNLSQFFSADEGRLFFKLNSKYQSVDRTKLDVLFRNPMVFACFETKSQHQWVPAMTVENILHTRKVMRDFFFQPFNEVLNEDSWAFLKAQTTSEAEFQSLKDNLAGAFVYKIAASWSEEAMIASASETKKYAINEDIKILSIMLNTAQSPESLIAEYEEQSRTQLEKDIQRYFDEVKNKDIKEKNITTHFREAILTIRSKILFKALTQSEDLLCDALFNVFTKSTTDKRVKKLVAPALYELAREGLLNGDHSVSLLATIESHLDKDKRAECGESIKKANQETKVVSPRSEKYSLARSRSTSPALITLSLLTSNPANTDADKTDQQPSPSSPSRQYEKRDRLRRNTSRASVIQLFPEAKDTTPGPSTSPTEPASSLSS